MGKVVGIKKIREKGIQLSAGGGGTGYGAHNHIATKRNDAVLGFGNSSRGLWGKKRIYPINLKKTKRRKDERYLGDRGKGERYMEKTGVERGLYGWSKKHKTS